MRPAACAARPPLAAAVLLLVTAAAAAAAAAGGQQAQQQQQQQPRHQQQQQQQQQRALSDAGAGDSAAPPAPAAAGAAAAPPPTRVFIDEGFFIGGETDILRAWIGASEGRLEVSGESSGGFMSIRGYYVPDKWDLYFSTRSACVMALPHMRPGQRVNCVPGVNDIALKKDFVRSWQEAYGEGAFGFIPRSYLLPEQYWVWRSHMAQAGPAPGAKWVLKANLHRGKGVSVVPQEVAAEKALEPGTEPNGYKHVVVQSFLQPQLELAGRSSYLRLWLLVTSVSPLRAYLFKGGIAVFGKQHGAAAAAKNSSLTGEDAARAASNDLIVNLWIQDRSKSPIWSLAKLGAHLDANPEAVAEEGGAAAGGAPPPGGGGPGERSLKGAAAAPRRRAFADAWADMRDAAVLVLAAGLSGMRGAAANASAPPNAAFEYFGLDFVLGASLRPRMLEVNAVPSMARRNASMCTRRAGAECVLLTQGAAAAAAAGPGGLVDGFDEQKEVFVHDMLKLLGQPVDAAAAAGGGGGGGPAAAAAALRAAAAALGFAPPPPPAPPPSGGEDGFRGAPGSEPRPRRVRRPRRPQRRLAAAAAAGAVADGAGAAPPRLRALMCGTADAANAAMPGAAFACARCLVPADLAALADAEAEFANLGRFEPAYDLIHAYALNAEAARAPGGGRGAAGADEAAARRLAEVRSQAGGAAKAPFLQDDPAAWARLHATWRQQVDAGRPPPGMDVMRHFTTDARLPPARKLPLGRLDYIMSAWLRVWREAAGGEGAQQPQQPQLAAACGGGMGLEPCLMARLERLTSHCYL
ncbi:MAG: hypothetical protein J3K34DRAFT_516940 [Monoraphidium minutum]|nr:MAG: hypothetical protein J3K34DRAFT_516940 [Monoraphidium minutum]